MNFDFFLQRKNSVLSKIDKSHIKKWDKKIILLCNKLNNLKDYYTTSSCSGRVVLIIDKEKKSPDLFLEVSHEQISLKWLKNKINGIIKNKKLKKLLIKFKCEPIILHVACRDLESASLLIEKAKNSGIKHSGIHSIKNKIIIEINGSDRLEFPIINKNKSLVNDKFLKLIVKKSNIKLKKSWKMIKDLEQSLS